MYHIFIMLLSVIFFYVFIAYYSYFALHFIDIHIIIYDTATVQHLYNQWIKNA